VADTEQVSAPSAPPPSLRARFRPRLTVAPLRVRPFRFLVLGQAISEFGNAFQVVALPLLIFARGGAAAQVGVVVSAFGFGRLITTPVAGILVDRYGAVRIMAFSDLGRMLLAVGLTAVAATGWGGTAAIAMIAGPVGLLAGLFMPAEWAVMPGLLPAEDLAAGNALNTTITYAAGLVGPSIAGLVVGFADPSVAFGVDAATFAVSALTLLAIARLRLTTASAKKTKQAKAKASGRADGAVDHSADEPRGLLGLLRGSPLLRAILVVTIVANLTMGGLNRVALPALATKGFGGGARGLGVMLAAFAAGSMIGGLFAAGFASVRSRGRAAMLSGLVLAVCVTLTPLAGLAGAAVLLVLAGAAATVTNVLVVTTVQKGTPPHLLGRTMSAIMFSGVSLFPVSVAVVGFLVDAYGSESFFYITGASLVTAFCFGLTRKAIRSADTG
jgi:MFS family permease